MRYFFHILGGIDTNQDVEGCTLSDPGSAMAVAAVIAAEIAADEKEHRRYVVYVVDELGNEVGKVPIASEIAK